jgi:hypothetical protein
MDQSQLVNLIDQFQWQINLDEGLTAIIASKPVDWRLIWDMKRQIDDGFRTVRFVNFADKKREMARWSELREFAQTKADRQREERRDKSERHRKDILYHAHKAHFSQAGTVIWDTLLPWDKMTAEQMKSLGESLKEAKRLLHEYKHEMLHEHKQECFEFIGEVMDRHNWWWNEYHQKNEQAWRERREKADAYRERAEANKRKSQEVKEKLQDTCRRRRENMDRNTSKLQEQEEKLERMRHKAEELKGMIEEDSPKWQEIHGQWLDDLNVQITDKESYVERLRTWIEQDRQVIEDIEKKLGGWRE